MEFTLTEEDAVRQFACSRPFERRTTLALSPRSDESPKRPTTQKWPACRTSRLRSRCC